MIRIKKERKKITHTKIKKYQTEMRDGRDVYGVIIAGNMQRFINNSFRTLGKLKIKWKYIAQPVDTCNVMISN